MLERDLQQEINRINGALEVLGLLRERLHLQRDELGAESGQEAVDEMLTQVEALQGEYGRRRAGLHPHHKNYQFFLTNTDVLPILHDCYVSICSKAARSPANSPGKPCAWPIGIYAWKTTDRNRS